MDEDVFIRSIFNRNKFTNSTHFFLPQLENRYISADSSFFIYQEPGQMTNEKTSQWNRTETHWIGDVPRNTVIYTPSCLGEYKLKDGKNE